MTWNVLNGLLDQVRVQSTFPGKIWMTLMFILRIAVVLKIGDVFNYERGTHICNTLQPGCDNVCFNRFFPISPIRYWSLMILVVSTPAILFFVYATHIVYQSDIQYPPDKKREESVALSSATNQVTNIPTADETYKTSNLSQDVGRRRARQRNNDGDCDVRSADNHESNEGVFACRAADAERMQRSNIEKMKLHHPELARAYWWHVLLRMALEVVFIVGQYFLYGWSVSELHVCRHYPCPSTVECYVSRPHEKTCVLWIMYALGFIACAVTAWEFWTMGISRAKAAISCCGSEETKEERRRLLAHEASQGQAGVLPISSSVESPRGDANVESV